MMRQQNQYANSGLDAYGGNRIQLHTQQMEYASGDYQGQFEAFTPPRDDTYLDSKVEPHRGWDRDGLDPSHSAAGRMVYEVSAAGSSKLMGRPQLVFSAAAAIQNCIVGQNFNDRQGIDASRSYYQGQSQRLDSRMHLERHGSSDNRPPRNNTDMDVEYEKSPFPQSFEALERKFLDDISKLAKEMNDAEDAENTRHREKINAINAQYQEQLMSVRTKHANRRDKFLQRESTSRQQQYQKAMIDRYSSGGPSPRNPQNFGGSAIPGAAGPYNISDRYDSFADGSRHYSSARGHGSYPRGQT